MTKLLVGSSLLFIVILIGLIGGLLVGLWVGWIAWPVQVTNVDVSDLKTSSQDEYIVLTASDYAFDQNLDRAKQRLAQLHDPKINDRLAALAKQYAQEGKPYATQVAALAVALGSTDNSIALIATTATPTITDTPTYTETPVPTDTSTPTLTPVATKTPVPAPTRTHTPRPTARPRATATPEPAPVAGTDWLPAYPAEWPGGARYQPASVAPGQKYWHLAKALYCDIKESRFDCLNLPGGGEGIGVYVILAGGKAPLIIDGKPANLEDKSSDPQCQCTYELFPDGKTIQVGNFPSDAISGLALSSVKTTIPQTHVRYFLTFQLVTR